MLPLLTLAAATLIAANAPSAPKTPKAPKAPASVRVEYRGPHEITTAGGNAVSTSFRLRNVSAKTYLFAPAIELPAGWRALTDGSKLRLTARATATRVVTILVPRTTPSGTYTIRFSATVNGKRAVDSVRVHIPKKVVAHVALESAPPLLLSGSTWTGTITLRNEGNAPAALRLLLDSVGAISVSPRHFAAQLQTGEHRTFTYQLSARGDADRKVRGRVIATLLSSETSVALDSAYTVVDMVPRPRELPTLIHSLPTHLRVRLEPNEQLMWAEVSGGGLLRDNGITSVQFLARGPSFTPSRFGEQPEYWAELNHPNLRARVGDQLFASSLTHDAQYGFGVSADGQVGPVKVAGFRFHNRLVSGDAPTSGGAVGVVLAPRQELSLQTTFDETRGTGATSARLQLSAARFAAVDAEVGVNSVGDRDPRAYSVRVRGDLPRLSYDGHVIRSDESYQGALAGVRSHNLTASYRSPAGAELTLSARNFAHRPPTPAAGETWQYEQSAYQAQLTWRDVASAEYLEQRSTNRSGAYLTDRTGRSAKVRGRVKAGAVLVMPQVEVGRVLDHTSAQQNDFQRGELAISVTRKHGSYLATNFSYTRGATVFRPDSRDVLSASVDAQVALGPRTTVLFNGQVQRERGPAGAADFVFGRVHLEQQLFGSHLVGVRANVSTVRQRVLKDAPAIAVDYRIPLGIPVGRARSVAHVVGRLVDQATGQPMPNVVLTLGERAVATDEQGRFSFPNLPPGEYYLQVDVVTVPAGYVLNVPQPLAVRARPGNTTRLALSMLRKASVTGRVQLVDSTGKIKPVANALLELFRDGEVQRRTSNADGRFEFNDLRPGKWQVRVVHAQTPPHFEFDRSVLEIEAQPSTERRVVFSARARQRTIRLQEEQKLEFR